MTYRGKESHKRDFETTEVVIYLHLSQLRPGVVEKITK